MTCDISCFQMTFSCHCEANFGSASYEISVKPWDYFSVPMAAKTGSDAPVSRYGHTIIHCDNDVMYIFGGRSLEHGLLNDIWLYSFITRTWTEIRPIVNSDKPAGR